MSFNTFGNFLKVTTFGESHGKAIGAVIDGIPSGLVITENFIQQFLNKRKPGTNSYVTPRVEKDIVEILSGVFENKTLGTPICLLIKNTNQNSKDYSNIKDIFRPNHGDYTWEQKFSIRDYRGGGRSSARETVARVAAGAIAFKILEHYNTKIYCALTKIGSEEIDYSNWNYNEINNNIFYSPDSNIIKKWKNLITLIKNNGDSIGSKIEIHVKNVPVGLGEPVFSKLEADLARALLSIPAVKSFEIGIGTNATTAKGSEIADEMYINNNNIEYTSNYSGGVQGGISNGNDIIIKIAIKPASSIRIAKNSINKKKEPVTVQTFGRHDPCVGIRAVPVAEAMVALTLADHILLHRARNNFL